MGGRIDAFVVAETVGNEYLLQLPAEKQQLITIHPQKYRTSQYFIMFSKNHPESENLIRIVDTGLAELIENGRRDELYHQMLNGYYREETR